MERALHGPTPSDDGVVPSFASAIAELGTTLAASRIGPGHNAEIPQLLAQLARAAKAQGMTPEAVLVAFRTAWEQEIPTPLDELRLGSGLTRHRAIDTLLTAYFAGEPDDT